MEKRHLATLTYEMKTPANAAVADAIAALQSKGNRQWEIFAETRLYGNKNRYQAMMVGNSVDMIEALLVTAQWKEYSAADGEANNHRYFHTTDLLGFTDLLPMTEDLRVPIELTMTTERHGNSERSTHVNCHAAVGEFVEGVVNPISCDHYLTLWKKDKHSPYIPVGYSIGSFPRASERSVVPISNEIEKDVHDEDLYIPGTIYKMTVSPEHLMRVYDIHYARIIPNRDE